MKIPPDVVLNTAVVAVCVASVLINLGAGGVSLFVYIESAGLAVPAIRLLAKALPAVRRVVPVDDHYRLTLLVLHALFILERFVAVENDQSGRFAVLCGFAVLQATITFSPVSTTWRTSHLPGSVPGIHLSRRRVFIVNASAAWCVTLFGMMASLVSDMVALTHARPDGCSGATLVPFLSMICFGLACACTAYVTNAAKRVVRHTAVVPAPPSAAGDEDKAEAEQPLLGKLPSAADFVGTDGASHVELASVQPILFSAVLTVSAVLFYQPHLTVSKTDPGVCETTYSQAAWLLPVAAALCLTGACMQWCIMQPASEEPASPATRPPLVLSPRGILNFVTSWYGRQVVLLANHCVSAVFFVSVFVRGVYQARMLVLSIVVLSVVGAVCAGNALAATSFARKVAPVDESFRVSTLFKAGLVCLKALVVATSGHHTTKWDIAVMFLFGVSLVILGATTLVNVAEMWRNTGDMRFAPRPRLLLATYSLGFLWAKVAAIIVVAEAHHMAADHSITTVLSITGTDLCLLAVMVLFMAYCNNEVARYLDGCLSVARAKRRGKGDEASPFDAVLSTKGASPSPNGVASLQPFVSFVALGGFSFFATEWGTYHTVIVMTYGVAVVQCLGMHWAFRGGVSGKKKQSLPARHLSAISMRDR